jgi:hypothetical protein
MRKKKGEPSLTLLLYQGASTGFSVAETFFGDGYIDYPRATSV